MLCGFHLNNNVNTDTCLKTAHQIGKLCMLKLWRFLCLLSRTLITIITTSCSFPEVWQPHSGWGQLLERLSPQIRTNAGMWHSQSVYSMRALLLYVETCLPLCHIEGDVTAVLSAITNICSERNKNLVQCKFIALSLFQYTVPVCYTFTRHAGSLTTAHTDPAYKCKVIMYLAP